MSISVEEFLQHWVSSGLASVAEAAAFRESLSSSSRTVEEVARELVRQKRLTKFQAQMVYQGKGTALVLGNYVILDKLGHGGIGQVYKAEHRRMKRLVAIKVLQSQFVKNAQAVERFKREVQAIARLNHPQIVAAYDADESHGVHFFVMECVEGQDLSSMIKVNGPLPLHLALDFVLQTAKGLQYAHEHGVIHRDIKPANLLLRQDGVIKILDMGLARLDDELAPGQAALTSTGSIMGTVDFMSPEQCLNTKHADARSDIYSLGCTLFNLLTANPVFGGETAVEKIFSHHNAPIPSVREFRPELPEVIDHILHRMLAKRPEDRIQTAAEVVAVLQQLLIPAGTGMNSAGAETLPGLPPVGTGASGWQIPSMPQIRTESKPTLTDDASLVGTSPNVILGEGLLVSVESDSRTISRAAQSRSAISWRMVPCVAGVVLLAVGGFAFWNWQSPKAPLKGAVAKSAPRRGDKVAAVEPAETNAQPSSETMITKVNPATTESPSAVTTLPETSPSPPSSTPTAAGKTLVVGVQSGEFGDLGSALSQAQPGDTVLIRHCGPLEFSPADLTGKTPLTIAGDVRDGIDYWPILRQAVARTPEPDASQPVAAFWGDEVSLSLRKVHLVLGGLKRLPLTSVVQAGKGKLEMTDCTLTVSSTAQPGSLPGNPVTLVRHAGTVGQLFDINLQRTFLRGERLQHFAAVMSGGQLTATCEQVGWAGGLGYWLQAHDSASVVRVNLERSTLYNFKGLLDAGLDTPVMPSADPRINIALTKCVLVGCYPSVEPLFRDATPESQDFEAAARKQVIKCQMSETLVHRVGPCFEASGDDQPKDLPAFLALIGAAGDASAIDVDPMFRVHPVRELLDETQPRDVQARLHRLGRKMPEALSADVGLDPAVLPAAVAALAARKYPTTNDAAQIPRGQPRVLRVHQKSGEYKTIEDAFKAAQDDDIIEIADDGPYIPRQQLDVSGKLPRSLFTTRALHITLRASEGSNPVVILTDKDQPGGVPLSNPTLPDSRYLALWSGPIGEFDGSRSMQIDGIHFRARMNPEIPHCFFYHFVIQYVRVTNCSFVTAPGKHLESSCVNLFFYTPVAWFENNAFFSPQPTTDTFLGHSTTHHGTPEQDQVVYLRNCFFGGPAFQRQHNNLSRKLQIVADHNTFGTSPFKVSTIDAAEFIATENLIVTETVPVDVHSESTRSVFQSGGSRNALWVGARPIAAKDRDAGVMALFPGPILKTPPSPEGTATAKDPYRRYRLKKGQVAATLAQDGGPAGMRTEYLPPLPMLPAELNLKR